MIKDQVLDIPFANQGKSYLISDIEWFCQIINNLFNIQTKAHRKTELIIDQLKRTIGENLHLISRHDLKNLKLNTDEVVFSISHSRSFFIEYFLDRFFSIFTHLMESCLSSINR